MNGREEEIARLRAIRLPVRRVELPDGTPVYLRPLTAGDTLLVSEEEGALSGLRVLALSLATEAGERMFTSENLADGVSLVGDLPAEYLAPINVALAEINHQDVDLVEVARRD